MLQLAKSAFYSLKKPKLAVGRGYRIGFVIHTEALFDATHWQHLMVFSRQYFDLTGKRLICPIMTPACARIARQMHQAGCSEELFKERVTTLSQNATLGYHGHFWTDPEHYEIPATELKGGRHGQAAIAAQFHGEMQWFKRHGFDHHGVYSAGWWYMHADVLALLLANGFELDFSSSFSPPFRNPYTRSLMKRHAIHGGEAFWVDDARRRLLCIQTLFGIDSHMGPHDAVRNITRLTSRASTDVTAVLCTHDYNLKDVIRQALLCIEHLTRVKAVQFWDYADFQGRQPAFLNPAKTVTFKAPAASEPPAGSEVRQRASG